MRLWLGWIWVGACLGLGACADPPPAERPSVDASARDRGLGLRDMFGTDAAALDGAMLDAAPPDDASDASQNPEMDQGVGGEGDVFVFEPIGDLGVDDPCGAAIDLNAEMAARGHYDGDLAGFVSTTLGSCGGAAGGELLFKYRVGPDEPEVVFATDHPQTTAPTVLYLRARCDDANDVACTRGTDAAPGQQLRVAPAGPGLIYLYVDTGSREGGGPFRLTAGPPAGPACSDGRDNDGDGLIDYPADQDCLSAGSDAERPDCIAEEPCDGHNLGPAFQDNSSTGNAWFAFAWRAPEDAEVTALEIFSGEAVGETAMALYSSVGGDPGERLGRGGFGLQRAVGWQGAQLDVPVRVVADTDYWVVWETIEGAQTPFEDGGEPVVYRGSFDQGATWRQPFGAGVKFRVFCCGL